MWSGSSNWVTMTNPTQSRRRTRPGTSPGESRRTLPRSRWRCRRRTRSGAGHPEAEHGRDVVVGSRRSPPAPSGPAVVQRLRGDIGVGPSGTLQAETDRAPSRAPHRVRSCRRHPRPGRSPRRRSPFRRPAAPTHQAELVARTRTEQYPLDARAAGHAPDLAPPLVDVERQVALGTRPLRNCWRSRVGSMRSQLCSFPRGCPRRHSILRGTDVSRITTGDGARSASG